MTTPRSEAPSFGHLRILCADDDDVWRELLVGMLRRAGAGVVAVPDGLAALGALQRSDYDVLVSDLSMPEMNGLELLREARRTDVAPPVRVAVSGETTWVAASHAAGFQQVLLKPVSRRDVLETIATLVPDASRPEKKPERLIGRRDLVTDLTAQS